MKKIAKLLALTLSLVMVFSCLAGCSKEEVKKIVNSAGQTAKKVIDTTKSDGSNDEPGNIKNFKSAKDDPTQIVKNCFSTIESGDIEASKSFFTSEDAFNQILMSQVNMDDMMASFGDPAEFGLTEKEFEEIVNDLLAKIFSGVDFEVGDSEVDGDKATVAITMTYPDFDSIDIESLLTEDLMMQAVAATGYTTDELSEMSEEEGMEIMPDLMKAMFELMGDAIVDSMNKADVLVVDGELELEYVDGEWIITNME